MVRGIECNEADLILKEYDIKFINMETKKSKNRTRNIVSHSAVYIKLFRLQSHANIYHKGQLIE